ncbi:hypothetical protein IWX50DRAFT_361951 [Phyllosticta citricarpa]
MGLSFKTHCDPAFGLLLLRFHGASCMQSAGLHQPPTKPSLSLPESERQNGSRIGHTFRMSIRARLTPYELSRPQFNFISTTYFIVRFPIPFHS